ncbi:MAG: hypothetical protein HUJ60_01240 [Bacilli bacterium]|nr:hypothetical protein [Bacilli bacterium]
MKKISALLLLSASLLLASCGGGEKPISSETPSEEPSVSSVVPSTTSEAPKSTTSETPKPSTTSETPKSTTSEAPKPSSSSSEEQQGTFAITGLDVVEEASKAYVKVTGTISGYANADAMKMAFGLVSTGSDATYIMGSATPAAADYKYAPTVTDGNFELKVDVSGVTFAGGTYTIMVGTVGKYAASTITQSSGTMGSGKAKVNGYRIYIRADLGALAADQLPPVSLTEAYVEAGTGDDAGKVFIYIGGELGITAAEFEAKDPFMQFQEVGGSWTTTRMDQIEGAVSCVTNGTKGYVKIDITSLGEKNYNTHLNINEKTQADCKMENNLNTKDTPVIVGAKAYAVYCNTAGTGQDEFWGNLALIITHSHQWGDPATEAIAEGSGLHAITCVGGETNTAYNAAAADLTSGQKTPAESGQGSTEKNTRLGKNSIYDDVWSIAGAAAGQYEVYLKARASQGNSNAWWSGGLAMDHGDSAGNNGNGNRDWRYNIKVDDGDAENIASEKKYSECGLNENTPAWTTVAMAKIMIGEGASTITLHNNNNGYAIWIYAVRLVRIGDYVAPSTKLTETTTRIEAEVPHTKSGDDAAGTITDDATVSGGKYIAGLTTSGNWFNKKTGTLNYNVKALEAVTVQVKAHYKTTSGENAFALVVDGGTSVNLGTASTEWTDVTSENIELTAGEHVITLKGLENTSADIDYIEIIKQAAEA